jgi:hypothetical protein
VLTQSASLAALLAVDFFIKGFIGLRKSPFTLLLRYILSALKVGVKPVNAGPKVFAAKIGFLFSLSVFVLLYFGFGGYGVLLSVMLGFFAFLEAAFGFCVACKIYGWLPSNLVS